MARILQSPSSEKASYLGVTAALAAFVVGVMLANMPLVVTSVAIGSVSTIAKLATQRRNPDSCVRQESQEQNVDEAAAAI